MNYAKINNMKVSWLKNRKSAQERQDTIFRNMSADKKVELGAAFWKLAKELVGDKIRYETRRPQTSSRSHR